MIVRGLLSLSVILLGLPVWAQPKIVPGTVGTPCKATADCLGDLSCDSIAQVCAKPISVRLKEECEGGEASVCGALAKAYFIEEFSSNVPDALAPDLPPDTAKHIQLALTYYMKGCDGGDAYSCYQLGGIHAGFFGDPGTVPKDVRKAVHYWRLGCDIASTAGTDACFALGMAYQKGSFGIPKTPTKASKYFRKSCDGGNEDACAVFAVPRKQQGP